MKTFKGVLIISLLLSAGLQPAFAEEELRWDSKTSSWNLYRNMMIMNQIRVEVGRTLQKVDQLDLDVKEFTASTGELKTGVQALQKKIANTEENLKSNRASIEAANIAMNNLQRLLAQYKEQVDDLHAKTDQKLAERALAQKAEIDRAFTLSKPRPPVVGEKPIKLDRAVTIEFKNGKTFNVRDAQAFLLFLQNQDQAGAVWLSNNPILAVRNSTEAFALRSGSLNDLESAIKSAGTAL